MYYTPARTENRGSKKIPKKMNSTKNKYNQTCGNN